MGERIAVLREGRIVQTGTPAELYEKPASSFVATMVGAPPMNLLPGVVRERPAGAVIELPFGEVDAGRWHDAVTPGTQVMFGIRPHDLAPAGTQQNGSRFAATVHLTEPLGDVTVLDVAAGGTVLKMALPEEEALAYAPGEELAIELSLADAHLFHPETGRALS